MRHYIVHNFDKFTKLWKNHPWEILFVAVIVTVYLVTRLGWPETIEFAYDQPKMAWETQKFIREGSFLTSHQYNDITPFGNFSWSSSFIFLLMPFFLISSDPITVSQLIAVYNLLSVLLVCYIGWRFFSPVVGVSAAFFLAIQPWWMIFSRMIYSPGMGPTLISLCILLTFLVVTRMRSRLIGAVIFVWGMLSQIYISHFSVIFVSFLGCLTSVRRGVHFRSLLSGIIFVLIMFTPPVYYYINHPEMFRAYFKAQNRFEAEQPFSERVTLLATDYLEVLSGGDFRFQLGTAFDEFNGQIGRLEYLSSFVMVIIISVLIYSVISLLWVRGDQLILRVLLLLWATGPVWFLSLVRVPEVVPRYFLLCMPAFSILFGLMIAEIVKRVHFVSLRVVILASIFALLSNWVVYMVMYCGFVRSYHYPAGFMSYFSDPPYQFAKEAMDWIESDASQKAYLNLVVSSDPQRPREFALLNAPRYHWEYVLKRGYGSQNEPRTGYYLIYYSPLKPEHETQEYRQFGPYIVLDNSQNL